jgi:hypothetical protein
MTIFAPVISKFFILKFLISIFFAILILAQSLNGLWVVLCFKMNQDYIAKNLCENRARPRLRCNGKCHLVKSMQATNEQDKKQPSKYSKHTFEVAYYFRKNPIIVTHPTAFFVKKQDLVASYLMEMHSSFLTDIFHPPSAAVS